MLRIIRMSLGVLVVTSLGCASGPKLKVEDAELMKVSAADLTSVDDAKEQVRSAGAAVADAEKAEKAAERSVKIADLGVDRAKLDLEIAQLKFDAAQETKDAEAMLPAQAARQAATEALRIAEAELPFRKAERSHRTAIREEAEAGLAEARAALELAKLEVVLSGQPQPGLEGEKRRADFKAQLLAAQTKRAEAHRSVTAVAIEVDHARRAWQALSPATSPAPPERSEDVTAASAP